MGITSLVTSDSDLFENRVVVDIISLDAVILEECGSQMQYNWCSYKKRRDDMETESDK